MRTTSNLLDTMSRRLGVRCSIRADAARPAINELLTRRCTNAFRPDEPSPQLMRETYGEIVDWAEDLTATAEAENRDLTPEESSLFDRAMRRSRALLAQAETIERDRSNAADRVLGTGDSRRAGEPLDGDGTRPSLFGARSEWIDDRGRPVYALRRGQMLSALPSDGPRIHTPHALGHVVRAMARGDWSRCPADVRAAMSGDSNTLGGAMVPNPLSAQVIDYARAQSAIWRAGAVTIPMDSDTLTIARQTEDPDMELRAENVAFTLGDLAFDAIHFTSRKLGAVVVMSRELASDAPNAAEVVSMALAKGLAAEVDRLALRGNGSLEPNGLINLDIGETTSVGGILWTDVHNAAVAIRALNHTPNAYVCHPTIAGDLDILTSGDGTNSAALWLGPPPSLAGIERFETTNLTTADLVVGDFSKLIIGIRQTAMLEVSTEAGDFFAKHQVGIKITFRFDVAATHPAAFHNLAGITT